MIHRISLTTGFVVVAFWLAAAAIATPEFGESARRCPDIFQEAPSPLQPPPPPLDARRLALLSNLTGPERLRRIAGPLLVPRPVGSAGHAEVRDRLAGFLRRLGWRVELDAFAAETPAGWRRFASVVATRQPPGPPQGPPRPVLVLAAHYDTAPVPGLGGGDFVGATDSAVPCAILLMLAEALEAVADASASAAVRVVFFDGEESVGGRWTPRDSLYGSRHLATRWLREDGVNPGCPAAAEVADLVLLDLIGGPGPRLEFAALPGPDRLVAKERRDFARLAAAEARLRDAGLLPEAAGLPRIFSVGSQRRPAPLDTVEDDHTPFRRLGVPALHLIPRRFPPGWHTLADSADSVNWDHSAAVARVLLAWLLKSISGAPAEE